MSNGQFKKFLATRGASACIARANLPLEILQFVCLKIDQAQRHPYWMFDVGRSMFDVLLFLDHILSVIHCSGLVDFKLVCFSTRNSDQERLTRYQRSANFLLDLGSVFDFLPHLMNPGIECLADLIHIIQNFYGPGLIFLICADTFNGSR